MGRQATSQDSVVGVKLGHYRVVEKVGAGGMGEVYRARDEHLARDVAIKVLPPGTLIDEPARRRFHKEALILSQLNHPNIATIHDFDTEEGVDFLVMEYVPGTTLGKKVEGGPLPQKEVLRLGLQLAEGLVAAHDQGVVHRDLKPDNLRLTNDGKLKILDFGLAKLRAPVSASAATESLSEAGGLTGTLPYMAPEQLLGEQVDARTDIHAAGMVLYEMATGHYPFAGTDSSQIISAILRKLPRAPTAVNPQVSPELERIISKCLEKEPDNRYQSAKELGIDLRRLLAPSTDKEIEVPVRRKRLWGIAFAIALVVAAGAIAWRIYVYLHPKPGLLSANDTIVIADLENKTSDAVFDGTLKQGLLVQLGQSPFFNIVPDNRVRLTLQQMGRSPRDILNDQVALEVCRRNQSKALIGGSIASVGTRYILAVKAVNCVSGAALAEEQSEVSKKEDVLDALGKQGNIVRRRLGESLASIAKFDVPIYQATTPSLDALQAYSFGVQQHNQGSNQSAIVLYKRAVELDPGFASAYAALSAVYSNIEQS